METESKRKSKNKLKRKERSEPAYTSSRWTPYLKVCRDVFCLVPE